ncbi:hypothetical protein N0V88_003442 [Collariella sp. IMI 366227]|nr:hypothetical protein N0V88_003442 [Collariella sp. IMI 366227]
MQSMQRQFGRLLTKGPGDNAKISAILNDYEDVDKVLAKSIQIIEDAKLWRDSWVALVNSQLQVVTEFEGLYDPITGASDGVSRQAAPTPELLLERTFRLKTAYSGLKAELTEELASIETHVVNTATDARDCLAPMRKTIKKRENKRLDYERAQEKALKLERKPGRTPKENSALAKAEVEVSRTADVRKQHQPVHSSHPWLTTNQDFAVADDHLRQTLPPLIRAAFTLVEPLLYNLILIQNRLMGLYYTILHDYCTELDFPSPPPAMETVTATFNTVFGPVRSEIESIGFLVRSKAARESMSKATESSTRPTFPSNSTRSVSSALISGGPKARMLRAPSANSLPPPTPNSFSSSTHAGITPSAATDFTTATILGGAMVRRSATPSSSSASITSAQREYFDGLSPAFRKPSSISNEANEVNNIVTNGTTGKFNHSLIVSNKKKPPPPPPKKPKPEEWVVAQFRFPGEGKGDLAFQPGDRIRVVKKTGTDQDWF